MQKRYQTVREFYPYYLSQHRDPTCRRLHFVGSLWALVWLAVSLLTLEAIYLLPALLGGYGFAWIGHFFFEKNRPATFKYPVLSFLCDWLLFKDILFRTLPQVPSTQNR